MTVTKSVRFTGRFTSLPQLGPMVKGGTRIRWPKGKAPRKVRTKKRAAQPTEPADSAAVKKARQESVHGLGGLAAAAAHAPAASEVAEEAVPHGWWVCQHCTSQNPPIDKKCHQCEQWRPVKREANVGAGRMRLDM